VIRFLLKGLWRDPLRSRFPLVVVVAGVALTVLLHCWVSGVMGEMTDFNARFLTGHVRVLTRAAAAHPDLASNDLALENVAALCRRLGQRHPDLLWVPRIRFAGLLDIPDSRGETRAQSTVTGWGVALRNDPRGEIRRLGLEQGLVRGRYPSAPGEALLSDLLTRTLNLALGDRVTLLVNTMYGAMSVHNFRVVGTVAFGARAMDRGAVIMDIADARAAMDMQDAADEVLGFFRAGAYPPARAGTLSRAFNAAAAAATPGGEFTPVMLDLRAQKGMGALLDYTARLKRVILLVFLLAVSVVLWNAGLLGGIRRYGEFGVRLALGESKRNVYTTLLAEYALLGLAGSVLGTAVGLAFAFYLQVRGVDIGDMVKGATMMMPTVFRAQVNPAAFVIGFVPGLCSTVLGALLSGAGIFTRRTAQLFKELDV
jgi:putative ABC transport system permease protein